jgi:hypothetical protein
VAEFTETITCRRLEVVDGDGVVRFLVECIADADSANVELFTPKRNGSLVLFADELAVGVQVWSRGNTAVTGSVGLDGQSVVEVSDPRTMATLFEASAE